MREFLEIARDISAVEWFEGFAVFGVLAMVGMALFALI